MKQKEIINKIKNLNWNQAKPIEIIYISLQTAIEFASSLRAGLIIHPNNPALIEMAEGELETENLQYGDYKKIADHWEFLDHFISKSEHDIKPVIPEKVKIATKNYCDFVYSLNDEQKLITVCSREQELSGIFSKILISHDWESLDLQYYQYYLQTHIDLDSKDGGHGELTKNLIKETPQLLDFWKRRLELYHSLFV